MEVKFNLPLLPLRDIVVFPNMVIPLFVGRDKSINALNEVMKKEKKIILVTQKNSEVDDPTKNDVFTYGCESNILQLLKLPDGTVKVLVEGEKRIKITKHSEEANNFLTCEVEIAEDKIDGNDLREVIEASKELVDLCRRNQGPGILECMTYRWRGHVGPSWDEDVGLKRKDELKDWVVKDPIKREKNRLLSKGHKEEDLNSLEDKVSEETSSIISSSRSSLFPDPSTVLENLYS